MGIFQQFPYTNFHEMNLDEIIKLVSALDKKVDDFEYSIQEEIDTWITAHPEYVTTVMDGAITLPKLAADTDALIRAGAISPDSYTGTDAEKLQQAIDAGIAAGYGTIILSREYDITGSTLKINKKLMQDTTRIREYLSFIGTGSGCIIKKDTGYMFSGDIMEVDTDFAGGDILFFNVKFRCADAYDVSNWDLRASVFDCHRLIRITTLGCSFTLCGTVFDGSECTSSTNNMQSIRSVADTCTYSHAFAKFNYVWGFNLINGLIEKCDYGVVNADAAFLLNDIVIENTTIEGCYTGGIILNGGASGNGKNIRITGCYFEKNGTYDSGLNNVTYDILMDVRYNYRCVINNNTFVPNNYGRCIELPVYNNTHEINGNICNSVATNAYLIYISTVSPKWTRIAGVNQASSITITNNTNVVVNQYYGPLMNMFDGLTDNDLVTNLDSLTGTYTQNALIRIKTADSATNMPTGVTQGLLLNLAVNGSVLQILLTITGSATVAYARVRLSGIGWGTWLTI